MIKKYTVSPFLLIGIYIFIYSSCNNVNTENLAAETVENLEITLSKVEPYMDISPYFTAKEYNFPNSKFSDIYQIIPVDNQRLILVERWTNRISLVNEKEILWQLEGDPNDPFKFSTIVNVFFDSASNNIIVSEDFERKVFSLDGQYIRKERTEITYNDFVIINKTAWHATDNHDNRHLSKNQKTSHNLYSIRNQKTAAYLPQTIHGLKSRFSDGSNFFTSEQGLFYNQDFNDTIYQLNSENQTISAHHTISFVGKPSTFETVLREKPPSVARYIADNNLPWIKFSMPLAKNNYITVFYSGFEYRTHLTTATHSISAKKILINGVLYNTPYLQDEGVLAYSTSAEEHNFLQLLLKKDVQFSEWKTMLKEQFGQSSESTNLKVVILQPI